MSLVYNKSGQIGLTDDPALEATQYDILRSTVQARVSDPAMVDEYVAAYAQVAANLSMSIMEFVEMLNAQGTDYQQDIFMAAYLNDIRVANARIGVALDLGTPPWIKREIMP